MSALTVSVPVASIRFASCESPLSLGLGAETAQMLGELLTQADGPLLTQTIALLTAWLREQTPHWSKTQRAAIIQLISTLDERREEAALAAKPTRRVGGQRRTESTLQNRMGFLPHLLPQ